MNIFDTWSWNKFFSASFDGCEMAKTHYREDLTPLRQVVIYKNDALSVMNSNHANLEYRVESLQFVLERRLKSIR